MYLLQSASDYAGTLIVSSIIGIAILYNCIIFGVKAGNKELRLHIKLLTYLKIDEMKRGGYTSEEIGKIVDEVFPEKLQSDVKPRVPPMKLK